MKRILNTTLLTVILLSFTGCVPPTPSQETKENKIDNSAFIQKALQREPSATTQKHSESFEFRDRIYGKVFLWIDPDTGVEYMCIETGGVVKSITARYGSDGKVIVHNLDNQ